MSSGSGLLFWQC